MPKANYRKASYTDRQYTNNKKTERSTSGRNNVLNKPAKYKGPKKKSKTKKLDDAVSAMAKKFRESEEGKAFAKDKAAKAKKAGYKLDESGRIQKPKKEKKAAKPISRPKPQGSTSGGSKSYSRPVRSGVRSGQQRNRSVGPTQTPKEKLEPIIRSGQQADELAKQQVKEQETLAKQQAKEQERFAKEQQKAAEKALPDRDCCNTFFCKSS